ncbi:hypothetical protein GOC60_17225 [Sinorhizobium meliloti]|nr:hypothetical protein [Sinorhizobium meliloti]MDX0350204.1 hypothetical protein [Sinorhizobium meliloti]
MDTLKKLDLSGISLYPPSKDAEGGGRDEIRELVDRGIALAPIRHEVEATLQACEASIAEQQRLIDLIRKAMLDEEE